MVLKCEHSIEEENTAAPSNGMHLHRVVSPMPSCLPNDYNMPHEYPKYLQMQKTYYCCFLLRIGCEMLVDIVHKAALFTQLFISDQEKITPVYHLELYVIVLTFGCANIVFTK